MQREANQTRRGPDGDGPRAAFFAETLVLRDAQAVGRPYRYLEGRAVPYGIAADIGWYVEMHADGSFERSTKFGSGKAAPLLLFHDNRAWPAGHAEAWSHENGVGMLGVWRLNDTREAQQAAQLADAGDLTGLSVGFQPVRSDWTIVDDWNPDLGPAHKDQVVRLESRLLEVSLTPTPAFAEAQVSAIRSASMYSREARAAFIGRTEADRWRDELEKLRSG